MLRMTIHSALASLVGLTGVARLRNGPGQSLQAICVLYLQVERI
jgi:hypothetical protein